MHVRRWLFSFLALLVVLTSVVPSTAQKDKDKKKDDKKVTKPEAPPPALVVRTRSIDGLLTDARVLANLAGKEEAGKQIDATVRAVLGGKGFGGLDPKRPIGICSQLTEESTVLLLPLAEEKDFLALLESLNVKANKGDDGVFTIELDVSPTPIHFRFAGKHVHVSGHKECLDPFKLVDGEKVLSAASPGILSTELRLDQVPADAKRALVEKLQANLAEEEKKREDEEESRYKGRVAGAKVATRLLTDAVNDGGKLAARIDLDAKTSELTVEMSLAAQKGSKLERGIADLAKAKSLFSSLGGDASALNFLLHFQVGEEIVKSFLETYDGGIAKELEKEEDKAKRDAAEKLFKAIKPTIEGGDSDLGFSLLGTGPYTFVGGARLKNGLEVEKAFREVVKTLPDRSRAKIKLDVETVESIHVHRLDVQRDVDENAKRFLGDRPMFLAFRNDGVFLAGGAEGQASLKDALESSPRAGPVFSMDLSLSRLVKLMSGDNPHVKPSAEKAFGKGALRDGSDRISFRLEGGNALSSRVVVKGAALKFLFHLGEATRAKEAPKEEKEQEPKEEKPKEEKQDRTR